MSTRSRVGYTTTYPASEEEIKEFIINDLKWHCRTIIDQKLLWIVHACPEPQKGHLHFDLSKSNKRFLRVCPDCKEEVPLEIISYVKVQELKLRLV